MSKSFSKADIGRGAIWSIVNQSVSQILVLMIFLVTARFVPKEIFGVMAVAYMALDVFRQTVIESVAVAINSQKAPKDEDYNAAFLIILTGGFISAIIVFLMAGPVSIFMDNPLIEDAMHWIALAMTCSGLARTHQAWLGKHMKFKVLAISSGIAIVIAGSVSITLAVNGYFLESLIAQQLTSALIMTGILWLITPWRPSFKTGKENILFLLRYARHVSMNACLNLLNTQSDIFFSSYYLGAASTGVYNAAKRIIVAINMMMSTALGSVVLPTFASMSGDLDRLRKNYLRGVSYSSMITASAYAGLIATAPDLIHILMGEKWLGVAPILSILAVSGYITTITQYNSNIIYTFQKPQWQTRITAINAIANVALFFQFAQEGLLPLATAFTIKTVLLFPVSAGCALSLLKIPVKDYLRTLLPSIMISAVMAAIVWTLRIELLEWPLLARFPALVVTGIVVYMGLTLLLARKPFIEIWSILKEILLKRA